MDSIWSHSSAPDALHFVIAVQFAFAFYAARFLLDRFIFRVDGKLLMSLVVLLATCIYFLSDTLRTPYSNLLSQKKRFAIWLLSKGAAPLKLDEATQSKVVKCSESMWKLAYYGTVEICILKIAYNEPWFRDSNQYFKGWPNQELQLPLKLFYMCQCGFYLYSIAALLIWETRRKDFSVMMSHHVITVILIGYSYLTRFFQIGSVILALHDASDVFMEAAKVFKYSEKELGASVFFGFFAFTWLVLRLIFFPFWVIKSTSYDLCEYLKLSDVNSRLIYYVFNTMLLMLLVFHIYWWLLICSMINRQLKNRGKVGEDIRSDSEDDD